MQGQVYEQLTLFREDFPASRFPWLESKKEKGTTVTYGRRCLELSESLRRVASSVRTSLESSALPPGTWSRTWSVKDMTSSCLILKLRLSERRTEETGSPLWATPNTMDHLATRSPEAMERIAAGARKGRTRPSNLREQVDESAMRMWPTPKANSATGMSNPPNRQGGMDLQTAARLWPTPCATEARQGLQIRREGKKGTQQSLSTAVRIWPTPCSFDGKSLDTHLRSDATPTRSVLLSQKIAMFQESEAAANGGQLNPTWVEWLMGFPIGWTDLNASETQ